MGVQVGQTAIDENGILGQIINVYPNTSRLLLITDELQSVSVTVRRTGQRCYCDWRGYAKLTEAIIFLKLQTFALGMS